MAHERFLDRDQQPDMAKIRKRIGKEVLPVWDDVLAHLQEHFLSFESELIFYSAQHGWGIRYRREAQQLLVLFPERRSFSTLVTLTPEEDEAVLEQINYFNQKFREELNRPSTLPQGRWLWVRIEDHTDFVGLQLILDLKEI
ncbi:DUF3788 domain-containing protein [bacterium]|nr:DUF3788 domain-containing protein [bacterium]